MGTSRKKTLLFPIFYCLFIILPNSYSNAELKNKNYNGLDINGITYCMTCHTPGVASELNISEPLWADEVKTTEFETYTSSNTSEHEKGGFPTGKTKLCLGCHDGIIASEDKNVYSKAKQFMGTGKFSYTSHKNHPVSIIYNSYLALKNKNLADPSTEPSGLGGTIAEDLLEDGKIVCTSCHNIHTMGEGRFNSNNHFNGEKTAITRALKIPNVNSALCLTCHKL